MRMFNYMYFNKKNTFSHNKGVKQKMSYFLKVIISNLKMKSSNLDKLQRRIVSFLPYTTNISFGSQINCF